MSPPRKKKRKRPSTLTSNEATARIDSMTQLIHNDVRIALSAEATLEVGNAIVMENPKRKFSGAQAYETIATSLALNLAISLSRLFDSGSKRFPPNKRDIASIPLLLRLIKQRRCQKKLIEKAREWTPQIPRLADVNASACIQSIEGAIAAYENPPDRTAFRRANAKLREFRNVRLAHSMMSEVLDSVPTYGELFMLSDVARNVTDEVLHAVTGQAKQLREIEAMYREQANYFWMKAL